ncbi:hypothetical protein XENOCAPTIV_016423 [Xenoophorus captivus]|uniref:C2H2-type domain-containing protein n=1 Tax=Xenoophorus captivus TaxID=1517983 RepID=A0ABV0RUZ9_9TELE
MRTRHASSSCCTCANRRCLFRLEENMEGGGGGHRGVRVKLQVCFRDPPVLGVSVTISDDVKDATQCSHSSCFNLMIFPLPYLARSQKSGPDLSPICQFGFLILKLFWCTLSAPIKSKLISIHWNNLSTESDQCLLMSLPVSQASFQTGPSGPHLRHLQQGVQEQLQPAAAPVRPHWHQDEGPSGAGEGGRSEGGTVGEADHPPVSASAHTAPSTSTSCLHRPGHPLPIRSTCQPGRTAGLRVHRSGNCHHGCSASAHPGCDHCRGLHGPGGFAGSGGMEPDSESRTCLHVVHAGFTCSTKTFGLQMENITYDEIHFPCSAAQNPNPAPNTNQVRKNHACEACGKAFRDVYHLNRHRLSHSDEKPYSCPICQQRFKRKDRMSYHVRSHQGGVEKPYICPHCSKAFSRPDHLNSHVRQVHSTERPFKCTTCTSAFATRDRLRAHLIRHEEKVPCHICGKLLSAAYITDHMRVHNQSQHHSCHLCNRSFTTLTYLRVHAQKHHGQEWKESGGVRGPFGGAGGMLLCQLCGVQCKTATQLQGHMGTHAQQGDPTPNQTSEKPVDTTSVAGTVSRPNTVGLLVTDCSSIAAQPHS